MKLHSIEIEAKNCRKAFKNFPSDGFTLHCHHELLGEPLKEPAKNRIAYILSNKSEHEQALRLRLFRPITESQLELCEGYTEYNKACADWHKASDEYNKACAEYDKAYAEYDKACAEVNKACADWHKASDEYNKANAEFNKACADWHKASDEYNKACAENNKAYAEYDKACAEYYKAYDEFSKEVHDKFCIKDCPWNGKTIFP